MASYDYRCRDCDAAFEVQRGITAEEGVVRCPAGHTDVIRVWSTVGVATGGGSAAPASSGGGCCGGGCCG
jgi:putative FmdB family regulatory protein